MVAWFWGLRDGQTNDFSLGSRQLINRHKCGKGLTLVLDASINREVFFSGNSSKFERNLMSGLVCQNGRDSVEVIPKESNCSQIRNLWIDSPWQNHASLKK